MMVMKSVPAPCRLGDLLHGLVDIPGTQQQNIAALTMDSRQVMSGSLFLACPGVAGHGLDFVEQAVAQGAVAVVCEPGASWDEARIERLSDECTIPVILLPGLRREISRIAGRFYGHPSDHMDVIGVTGTNGKSTVSHALAQVLNTEQRCGLVGTLGNGFPDQLEQGTHTTPDPVSLQGLLADLLAQGAVAVAMEVSSHALSQFRTAAVNFNLALLTNLSRDHLDYHRDMADYAAAKQRLFEMPGLECAVLNYDDAFGREVLAGLPARVQAVIYTLDPKLTPPDGVAGWVCARKIEQSLTGMRIRFDSCWGNGELTTALLGRFNAANLMAVLAVLLQRGWDLPKALSHLAQVRTVPGRMERFGAKDQPLVVVDYAHTPDALEQVLLALRGHCSGRLICLFGCGGDRDKGKRPLMGQVASRLADQLVVTDDNPRSEDGGRIIEEILQGVPKGFPVFTVRNRAQAIEQAIALAKPGDLVLVAGKGHETTQQAGDLTLPFSDREQVARVLSQWGGEA